MTQPEKKPPQGSPSRTVVIIAVAVLIIVAIAGIVLAGMKAPTEPAVATAPTPMPVTAASSAAASAPADEIPKDVRFAVGSDKLPANANDGIARFAELLRSSASSVRVSAQFVGGENKPRDQALAKARTGTIKHALEADGITAGKIEIEITEQPVGYLTEEAGNRVDLTLR